MTREEEEVGGQKRKTRTDMIKVLGLIHKRENLRDSRIAWFMFHKIYCMFSYINKKEEINYSMVLTSIS